MSVSWLNCDRVSGWVSLEGTFWVGTILPSACTPNHGEQVLINPPGLGCQKCWFESLIFWRIGVSSEPKWGPPCQKTKRFEELSASTNKHKHTNTQTNKQTNKRTNERTNERTNKQTNKHTNKQTTKKQRNKQTNERTNERTNTAYDFKLRLCWVGLVQTLRRPKSPGSSCQRKKWMS